MGDAPLAPTFTTETLKHECVCPCIVAQIPEKPRVVVRQFQVIACQGAQSWSYGHQACWAGTTPTVNFPDLASFPWTDPFVWFGFCWLRDGSAVCITFLSRKQHRSLRTVSPEPGFQRWDWIYEPEAVHPHEGLALQQMKLLQGLKVKKILPRP